MRKQRRFQQLDVFTSEPLRGCETLRPCWR